MGDEANWQDHPDQPFCLQNCLAVWKRGKRHKVSVAAVGFEGTDLVQVPPWEEIKMRGRFDLLGAGWDVMGYWCQKGWQGPGMELKYAQEIGICPCGGMNSPPCPGVGQEPPPDIPVQAGEGGEGSAELLRGCDPPETLLWEEAVSAGLSTEFRQFL